MSACYLRDGLDSAYISTWGCRYTYIKLSPSYTECRALALGWLAYVTTWVVPRSIIQAVNCILRHFLFGVLLLRLKHKWTACWYILNAWIRSPAEPIERWRQCFFHLLTCVDKESTNGSHWLVVEKPRADVATATTAAPRTTWMSSRWAAICFVTPPKWFFFKQVQITVRSRLNVDPECVRGKGGGDNLIPCFDPCICLVLPCLNRFKPSQGEFSCLERKNYEAEWVDVVSRVPVSSCVHLQGGCLRLESERFMSMLSKLGEGWTPNAA